MKPKNSLIIILAFFLQSSATAQSYKKRVKEAQINLEKKEYSYAIENLVNLINSSVKPTKKKKVEELKNLINSCFDKMKYNFTNQLDDIEKTLLNETNNLKITNNLKTKNKLLKKLQKVCIILKEPDINNWIDSDIKDYKTQIQQTEKQISKFVILAFSEMYEKCSISEIELDKKINEAFDGITLELKTKCRILSKQTKEAYALIEKISVDGELQNKITHIKKIASKYEKLGTIRVAIIPFEYEAGQDQYKGVAKLISTSIAEKLVREKSFSYIEFVDRDALDEILRELALIDNKKITKETADKFKQAYGINYLVTGMVSLISIEPIEESKTQRESYYSIQIGEEMYIDKNGKKKTRAKYGDQPFTFDHISKEGGVTINGFYRITSMFDANMAEIETVEEGESFYCDWAKFLTGSIRAFNEMSKYKKNINDIPLEKCSTPSQDTLVKKTSEKFANKIFNGLKFHLSNLVK